MKLRSFNIKSSVIRLVSPQFAAKYLEDRGQFISLSLTTFQDGEITELMFSLILSLESLENYLPSLVSHHATSGANCWRHLRLLRGQ